MTWVSDPILILILCANRAHRYFRAFIIGNEHPISFNGLTFHAFPCPFTSEPAYPSAQCLRQVSCRLSTLSHIRLALWLTKLSHLNKDSFLCRTLSFHLIVLAWDLEVVQRLGEFCQTHPRPSTKDRVHFQITTPQSALLDRFDSRSTFHNGHLGSLVSGRDGLQATCSSASFQTK